MKLPSALPIPEADKRDPWLTRLVNGLAQHFQLLVRALNGNLGFGNGVDVENIRGKWHTYTTNAIADTEDALAHNLGVVPIGILVFQQDKAGVLYKGGTAWTASNIYLKCNVASVTVTLFILTGPQTS